MTPAFCFCSHSKTPARIISKYLQYAYWPWGICLVNFFLRFSAGQHLNRPLHYVKNGIDLLFDIGKIVFSGQSNFQNGINLLFDLEKSGGHLASYPQCIVSCRFWSYQREKPNGRRQQHIIGIYSRTCYEQPPL